MSFTRRTPLFRVPKKGIFLLLLIVFSGCATRSEINRFKVQMDYLEQSNAELERQVAHLDSLLDQQMKLLRTQTAQNDLYMQTVQEELRAVLNALQESGVQVEQVTQKLEDVTAKLAQPQLPPTSQQDTTADTSAEGPPQPSNLPSAELLFRTAFLNQAKGEYQEAIKGYEQLVKKHPSSSFTHQAIYQLGECYFALGNYNQSINYFTKLLKEYEGSLLVPAALYKIASAYIELDNNSMAKAYLKQLLREYPKTNEAKLAEEKLKGL